MNLEMINHFNVILVISREYIVYILLVISCNKSLFFSCFHQKIVVSRYANFTHRKDPQSMAFTLLGGFIL